MQTKLSKTKPALALILCLSLLIALPIPAFAAQKISNPGNFGRIDGIDADPAVGVHNSYAWCAEMFAQRDADYLWVGTNRDMGHTLMGAAANVVGGAMAVVAGMLSSLAGLPKTSEDAAGKIYRQRAGDSDAPWELMYENPAINGYRRMILFGGNLYVCAGLINTPEYDYSVILRFKPGFKAGDEPDIVLWENLMREENGDLAPLGEYFRAACVYENKLYIGTFDSKIYVTDGAGLTNLTPNQGAKSTGWELFTDLMEHPDFPHNDGVTVAGTDYVLKNTTYIWDMVGFEGSLYAVVSQIGGFNMFKLTPQSSGGPVIKQIVGKGASAKYPDGVGVKWQISASPYVANFGGKEYVYVSTFANGPGVLSNFARGMVAFAFENNFCPPSMYRFDADDNWEVVVGDKSGRFMSADKQGATLPVIGNQRAGFFPVGDWQKDNLSFNQYIWWMTQYDGKLYASTWDLNVFKKNNPAMVVVNLLMAVLDSYGGALSLDDGFSLGMIPRLLLGIPGAIWAMLKTIPMWFSVAKYIEWTNPPGFDLFVSEDGVNFSPVTVNGLGNGENYGGRVLLPTQYGLFVCTANPFGGAQVWRLDDIKKELQPNIPKVIELKVGETFKASLRGLDMPNGAIVTMEGECGNAEITLAHRSSGTIIDTTSKITRIGPQYIECQKNKCHPVRMYDIVFTGVAAGEQDVTLRFRWNGVEVSRTVKVIVTN